MLAVWGDGEARVWWVGGPIEDSSSTLVAREFWRLFAFFKRARQT